MFLALDACRLDGTGKILTRLKSPASFKWRWH
jgi:hypothetical protein